MKDHTKLQTLRRTALMLIAICAFTSAVAQSPVRITGKVTDAKTAEPLQSATVVIDGSTTGTTTDAAGVYSIEIKSPEAVLLFEYLGYQSQKIKVGTKTTVDAQLATDTQLEEIVVIGYSEVKKSDLTGSVTNIRMSDVKDVPVASVDQALQGRIAGADIMSTSGDPTASTSIRIRGSRSITASNEPLIVVDGVMDAVADLSDINSADIESISVLKDASSTAIYGARGANGVIIITTKQGSATPSQRPQVTFKADVGFSKLARKLDVMNATEFALFRNDVQAYNWAMGSRPIADYTYSDPYALGKGTNWVDEITRVAPYQNYNLSIYGRSKNTTYFGSLGYSDIRGIVDQSGFARTTGRLNVQHQLAKWIKLGANISVSYRDEDNNKAAIGGTNVWSAATYLAPTISPTDTYNPFYGSGMTINNPRYTINLTDNSLERFASTDTFSIELTPVKGLKIVSKNTYYLYQRHDYVYKSSLLPAKNDGDGADAYRAEYDQRQLSTENTATYSYKAKSGHYFDVMGGFVASRARYNGLTLNGKGFLVDDNKWNNMNGITDKENYTATSYTNLVKKMSVLARANYNFKKRYYVTFTGRYDGSSNFAKNNKWGFFPSGALKWVVSNERFLKSARWIDELALRISAGRTGNDAIKPYRSLSALGSSTEGYLLGGSQSSTYYPIRLESDNLTWETTDLYNVALDASLFKNRLNITLEGYIAKTRDLLLEVQKAAQTGYTSHYENIGRTSNKGIELSIESRNIVHRNFTWSTTLTLAHNKQMVENIGSEDFVIALESPGNSKYMMYGYVKGYPLNALWGFKYGGVWHNQDEVARNSVTKTYASSTTKTANGDPRYLDVNHDGTLNNDDLVYLGNADPYLYGGLQNTFNIHKNLKLGVFFTYSLGGKIYNYSELYMSGSYMTNQYRYMENAWHAVRNPDSDLPRAGSVQVHVPSDLQVHDASFLRLKNVSIGYTFDLRKKTRVLRDITLSVIGENLWLWSKYNGFDPDVSTESEGSTLRRVDMGAYPRARTYTFSIQIRY